MPAGALWPSRWAASLTRLSCHLLLPKGRGDNFRVCARETAQEVHSGHCPWQRRKGVHNGGMVRPEDILRDDTGCTWGVLRCSSLQSQLLLYLT